jgi:membrane protease subunit HflK
MPFSNKPGGPWGGDGGNKGGGPWGGGGDNGGGNKGGGGGGGGPGGPGGQGPDMDELLRQGRDRLKVIFGGGDGSGGSGGSGPSEGLGRGGWALIGLIAVGAWVFNSVYTVAPEELAVELLFGEEYGIRESGLNFAPWPVVTYEKLPVTRENIIDIGSEPSSSLARNRRADTGLMLTGDENIVDIDFQVVWNIADPAKFLFNLAAPDATIRAVSESAMREVIGRSELKPILNRDRAAVSDEVATLIQSTLASYESGVNIVRINFDKADPPVEVIDAFRDVQAASQDRDKSEKQAEAYANQRLAGARGESAEQLQEAEAYAAQTVNEAEGEAARFISVYDEYAQAKDVTRKRLYLETMERVLAAVDKVIIDDAVSGSGQGVVPYLPLNELRKGGTK